MKTFQFGNYKFTFYNNQLNEYNYINGHWELVNTISMNYKQAYNYLNNWCNK